MIALLSALARLADPPLDPSGDEARSLLRRELAEPEYNDTNLIERIRALGRCGCSTTASAPPRTSRRSATFAAIVIGLLLASASGCWCRGPVARPGRAPTGHRP